MYDKIHYKKKKKNQQQQQKNTGGLGIREAGEIEGGLGYSVAAGGSLPDAATGLAGIPRLWPTVLVLQGLRVCLESDVCLPPPASVFGLSMGSYKGKALITH